MILAADYRRRAEDCAKRAADAQDDFHRKNFSQLAAMWTEMADKTEGRAAAAEIVERAERAERQAIDDALATIKNARAS
jgi:hypothetical protein